VFTGRRVQAGICQAEALYRLATYDMRIDDFVDVSLGDVAVPDGVRVDHEVGAVFALVETAGLVGAYFSFESAFG